MKYKIVSFIRVDSDDYEVYENLVDAVKDLEHYYTIHPEDIFQVEIVENPND